MKNCIFYPLKLALIFAALVAAALLVGGCGTLVRLEYQNPDYGAAAIEFKIPNQGGYAK